MPGHSRFIPQGVIPAALLPFDDELAIDEASFRAHLRAVAATEGLCAITNPVVNSYKRINAPPTLSGATWSPNAVTYSGNNRTHMIRVPDGERAWRRIWPESIVGKKSLPMKRISPSEPNENSMNPASTGTR